MNKRRIAKLSKELRKQPTDSEKILWQYLRNRKLNGLKFYRQKPIFYAYEKRYLFFIADFYCYEKKLVIELDGGIHELQKEYDEQRDIILNNLGLRVLRIKNEELKEINKVLQRIIEI
ncbi:MAG: endonuclease domain-containing protein [Bacteroidales bacterium]|nr:endonuclease domain-containing protein [Bacteroidales bacterium]HOK99624.1 endonuclease domain-containing protein [Bacteroidales bacterium]HPO66113.1 endonuclease domain-containing protein [Bacteroidales bacterium]